MSIIKAATTVEFSGKSLQNTTEYTNAHRRDTQEQQQQQVPDSEDYGWDEWPGEDNGGGSFFDFFF